MKQFLIFLFLLCSTSMFAQDVIVKKDGTTILSKVLEVNVSDIKYKKYSNQNGPIYTINKSEIIAINYENGEKDSFDEIPQTNDSEGSTPSFITPVADQRNSTLLSWYNKHYSPTEKMKKGGKTENYMLIFWLSPSSIISNDDIEVTLERNVSWQESGEKGKGGWWQQLYYTIKITNKSDRIIYVDKGNCFRNENNRAAFCYYGNTETANYTHNQGGNVSVGLGGIANAIGVGGLAGNVLSGISVGGGRGYSISKTYSEQRIIAIPPHGNRSLTEPRFINYTKHKSEMVESAETFDFCQLQSSKICFGGTDGVFRWRNDNNSNFQFNFGTLKKGEVKTYSETDSPYKREYVFVYSKDEDFSSYSMMFMTWYLHEVIGSGTLYRYNGFGSLNCKDYEYIEGINRYTIEGFYGQGDKHFE